MPEVSVPTPAAEPAASDTAATPPAPGEGEPKYVTASDFSAAMEKMTRDTKAQLGRLNKAITDLAAGKPGDADDEPSDAPPADGDEPPAVKAAKTRLRKQEQALRQQQEALQLGTVRNAITAKMQQAGVNPALLGLAVDGVIARHRQNITVSTGDFGEQAITLNTGTEFVSLDDFVGNFLANDGKALLQPKSTPRLPGAGGGTVGGQIEITLAEAQSGRISPKDLKSGKYVIKE